MEVCAPIALCFVPFATMFLLLAILAPGISVGREFLFSLAALMSFIPAVLIECFLAKFFFQSRRTTFLQNLLYSIFFCGFAEEGMKAAAFFPFRIKGERPLNFFLYSLLAGMAFGCFESAVYVLKALNANAGGNFLRLIFLRAATALVIHTFCAGLGGIFVFYRKKNRLNFWPLVCAIFIHGIYDFFCAFNTPVKFFCIAPLLLSIAECRIFFKNANEELEAF